MKLVIAEKPSVAISIGAVIGSNKKNDGYIEGNEYIVPQIPGERGNLFFALFITKPSV